jgi:hypothetical protein
MLGTPSTYAAYSAHTPDVVPGCVTLKKENIVLPVIEDPHISMEDSQNCGQLAAVVAFPPILPCS